MTTGLKVAADASGPGLTRSAEAYELIKQNILNGEFQPGDRLRSDQLRVELNMAITPIREALTLLRAEGLIVSEERRGCSVAPVSRDNLLDITMLLAEFDSIAIRESVKNGDAAWEGQILSSLHELNAMDKMGSDGKVRKEWEKLHAKFHEVLVSRCASPMLLQFRQNLVDQLTRYELMSEHYLTWQHDPAQEHTEIAQAVINRKSEDACYLIRKHSRAIAAAILGEELS